MNAEEAPGFVDTNILVYALAADDPKRSAVAQDLVRRLMLHQTLHTSTQVLQELYVTLTRKVRQPIPAGSGSPLPGADCCVVCNSARL
jgi:predicted nucleic acid-binding protein